MINKLFNLNNVGIVTSRDSFVIDDDNTILTEKIKDFFILEKNEIQQKYHLKENSGWKINEVKSKAKNFDENSIVKVSYRPFDEKFIYYNVNFIERSRSEVMQQIGRAHV